MSESFWQKDNLVTLVLFELAQWQILVNSPYNTFENLQIAKFAKMCKKLRAQFFLSYHKGRTAKLACLVALLSSTAKKVNLAYVIDLLLDILTYLSIVVLTCNKPSTT